MKVIRIALLALAAASAVGVSAQEVKALTGAGATFPYPIYSKWAYEYRNVTGVGLNYQSIGSGGGIQQISNKTVDFGASDAPMSGEDLTAKGLLQFPMIIGGVVPVFNAPGVQGGSLNLDGDEADAQRSACERCLRLSYSRRRDGIQAHKTKRI